MSDDGQQHPTGDAWGLALLDHLDGRIAGQLELEVDDGSIKPAMSPEWFFCDPGAWEREEREVLELVSDGPVLDLGAGAGRVALYFQELGFEVTAVESSPGAAEVCRRRGVADVRMQDLNDPPGDRRWGTVLLLCGNLGLGGSWDGNRELLRRLAQRCAPGALLVGDSVNYDGPAELGLRLRYRGLATPWWRQRNVAAHEVPALVAGTGWAVEHQVGAGDIDHYVALRLEGADYLEAAQTA